MKHVSISRPSYCFKLLTFVWIKYNNTRATSFNRKLPLWLRWKVFKRRSLSLLRFLSFIIYHHFFCWFPSHKHWLSVKLTSCLMWRMTSVICMKCFRMWSTRAYCQKSIYTPNINNNISNSREKKINYYLLRMSSWLWIEVSINLLLLHIFSHIIIHFIHNTRLISMKWNARAQPCETRSISHSFDSN